MKPIVAPTDFSHISKNAVDYAADFAAFVKADLSLLNVTPMPFSMEIPIPGFELDEMIKEAGREMEKTGMGLVPRHHSLISRIFQHNHAKEMATYTRIPVLAIHE
ncbi:MAG TPA: universal stress protein [Puia sp.]|nr:universal stress protein [Puia sp.]